MKVIHIFVILLMFLSACSSLEDKSITEPLSVKECDELIKKDYNYNKVFDLLDKLAKDGVPFTSSEIRTMESISYGHLKNFLKEWDDYDKITLKKEMYHKEWEAKYPLFREKVDSIDKYWKQSLEDFNPGNYVKIELTDIIDKTNVYLGSVKVKLRFTPLKGKIDGVTANFGLFPKGERNSLMMERNEVIINTPLASPMEYEDWLNFNSAFDISAEKVKTLPISQLLEEYDFATTIDEVIINGKAVYFQQGYFQVPVSVRDLWNTKAKDAAYYNVYKELVDSTIIFDIDYVNKRILDDAYVFDKQAATFFYEIYRNRLGY